MKRYPIRDNRSSQAIKPRVFDFLITDEGEQQIEVKEGHRKKTILLRDVREQILSILSSEGI